MSQPTADGIAEVLQHHPEPTRDIGWGDGLSYQVGGDPEGGGRLEVFPDAGVVRVTSRDAQLTLYRQPPPSLDGGQIRFTQHDRDGTLALTLTRDGRLRLDLVPVTPNQSTEDPPTTTAIPLPSPDIPTTVLLPNPAGTPNSKRSAAAENGPNSPVTDQQGIHVPIDTETAIYGDSGGARGPLQPPSETPEPAGSGETPVEKPARLTLAGRLGRLPSFRTTRNGTLIASFPLAVRDDAGETTWHTVLAFGQRAEQLRAGLAKGQHIEVIGYLHQRERATRAGEARVIDEVYATVVKPR